MVAPRMSARVLTQPRPKAVMQGMPACGLGCLLLSESSKPMPTEVALLVTACDGDHAWSIGPVTVMVSYGPHGKSKLRKRDDFVKAEQRKEDQPGQRSASDQTLRPRCTPAKKPPEDRVCDEGDECNVHEPHVGHVEELQRERAQSRVGERKTIGGPANIGIIAGRMPPRDAQ